MCSQKKVCNFFIGLLAMVGMMLSTGAMAEVPMSCTTVDTKSGKSSYSVTANPGVNGEFPAQVPCNPDDPSEGTCSDYAYTISSLDGSTTISHTLFAASVDQEFHSASPNADVAPPGEGDSSTGFLKYSAHEYAIRFNENATTYNASIYMKGPSSPQLSTAYVVGGKIHESCAIAGPGIPGNPFVQQAVSQQVVAAGGKCNATLHYNSKNEVVNITDVSNVDPLDPNVFCEADKPEPTPADKGKKLKLAVDGLPIQSGLEQAGKSGITFGTGTTTIYLPSGWAICTAAPCPGPTTYVWW